MRGTAAQKMDRIQMMPLMVSVVLQKSFCPEESHVASHNQIFKQFLEFLVTEFNFFIISFKI